MYRAYRSRGKTLITLVVTLRASYELAAVAIFTIAAYRASFTARAPARCPGRPPIVPWRGRRAMRHRTAARRRARTGSETVDPLRVRKQASRSRRAPHSTARCSAQSPATRRRCVLAEPYSSHTGESMALNERRPQEQRMHLLRHRRTFRLPHAAPRTQIPDTPPHTSIDSRTVPSLYRLKKAVPMPHLP